MAYKKFQKVPNLHVIVVKNIYIDKAYININ